NFYLRQLMWALRPAASTLSLHDALPIFEAVREIIEHFRSGADVVFLDAPVGAGKTLIGELVRRELGIDHAVYICSDRQLQDQFRSEEHTSELQSRENLVCRLLLEKKNAS